MIDHVLPPYAACNYRTLRFIFVRAPRIKDFARRAQLPRGESLDLLYRHFYEGQVGAASSPLSHAARSVGSTA